MWKQIMSEIAYLQAVTLFVGMAIGITVAFGAMRSRAESRRKEVNELTNKMHKTIEGIWWCLEQNDYEHNLAAAEICRKALGLEDGK